MLSFIVYILPFVLGPVALIALIVGGASFRRARAAPYFRIRREASKMGWRWLLIALVCGGGFYGTFKARDTLPPPELASLRPVTPTSPPPLSPLELSTPTLNPNATPKEPLAGPPTITPTQPTATPTSTPFISPIQSDVTPPANAGIKITAIANGITALLAPVNAGTEFPVGTPRIYAFIEFENMVNGISWSRAMLRDGAVIRSESEAWSRGEKGVAYYWFDAQGGWPAGHYQIQLYVGDKMIAQGVFTIK